MLTATNGSPHGKCGPLAYWSLKDGVLTIRGTGAMFNDYLHYSPESPGPWDKYKDEIFEIDIKDGITMVSGYAFYQLTNVEKATIPESMELVGQHAFDGCTALEDVYFYMNSGEVYFWAFLNCPGRKRIHIKSISDYLNVKLDQLQYPVGTDLILNGRKVTDLVIPAGATTTNTFNRMSIETVWIPNTATVRDTAFEMCPNLRSVTFESGSTVTVIPAVSFRACPVLVNINVPDTVEVIQGGAFAQCPLLQMSRLPLAIQRFPSNQYGAFQQSGSISISNLPDVITEIPPASFTSCTNVAISQFPPRITEIGSGALRDTASTVNRIPATVTTLGRGCLANNITALYFDGTPTTINFYAFENLDKCRDIYVPWTPGTVADAPWCARNATIHYNYTP